MEFLPFEDKNGSLLRGLHVPRSLTRGPVYVNLRPGPNRTRPARVAALGEKAAGERCPGIDGIKKEHDEFVKKESPSSVSCDMFLTGASARVEHYEIAAYTGLIGMARGLGERECVDLLSENPAEEKAALRLVESIGKRMAKDAKELVAA